jgi:hypothetical protein
MDAGNPVPGPVMVVFTLSRCTMCPFSPWTNLIFSVIIIQRLYLCSALVLGGSTHYLELYWLVKTLLSGLLMVVFAMSCHATWPFPPLSHLNVSVMIIQMLYLCFTLVLGGSTHYLGLCWMLETLCVDRSWLFSPCHIVVRGPSLHGPTSISLL